MTFKPSKYQQAIYDWVKENKSKALVVEACAGSGKTTTIVEALNIISPDKEVLFVAFNTHIADELNKRTPENVTALTYHKLGLRAIQANVGRVDIKDYKLSNMFKYLFPEAPSLYSSMRTLVSLTKATLTEPKDELLEELCFRHDIDMLDDPGYLFSIVRTMIAETSQRPNVVDFDDMCWLPIVLNYPMRKFDYVFIDEAQDTNKSQIELALRSVKSDGRIIAVGDRNQSIYGFRGADVDAIPNLIEGLKADTLPLSITYRCPKSHVKQCNELFPDIPIECAPKAKQGHIGRMSEDEFLNFVQQGDIVLCRCNAPLVSPAFKLIRRGKKVSIKGREIGTNLISMIEKAGVTNIDNLHSMMNEYCNKEIQKFVLKHKEMSIQNVEDKRDTIFAIAKEVYSLEDLKAKIASIFADTIPDITFSSVHKAKGLEANKVFIINRDLMPHPKARLNWEKIQEQNIMYVAFTRAKESIVFVNIER
jgi:DNA helicase-2/ATP-dependent DNA helicase PcrA